VIGCDVGAERVHTGKRRLNIFQILVYSGLVNSAASAAAQRSLADVLLKPPLINVDLLNWQAFDRAIDAGYTYARRMLDDHPHLPRLAAPRVRSRDVSSLEAELQRRARVAGA
jgi:predicted acylesterase/phospholipase RssA